VYLVSCTWDIVRKQKKYQMFVLFLEVMTFKRLFLFNNFFNFIFNIIENSKKKLVDTIETYWKHLYPGHFYIFRWIFSRVVTKSNSAYNMMNVKSSDSKLIWSLLKMLKKSHMHTFLTLVYRYEIILIKKEELAKQCNNPFSMPAILPYS
jgi:hypothetical protein